MSREIELEVFRVGGAASRGVTAKHIAEVATHDCDANPVAVCFGHPKSDTPAAGTISKLRADGNSLFATVKSFTDKAIDGIKSGEWINRSFAFFDPTHEANPRPGIWSPRHLALLGGAAPGIPGMGSLSKALAFDAAEDAVVVSGDPAPAVVYSGPATDVIFIASEKEATVADKSPEEIAFEARQGEQTERETRFAARVRSTFEASNNGRLDSMVQAGTISPADRDRLSLAFNSLDSEGAELTFGAGDKTTKATAVDTILTFIAGGPKRVPLGERKSPSGEPEPRQFKSATEFNAAAEKLAKDEGLTFEAAAERLSDAQA